MLRSVDISHRRQRRQRCDSGEAGAVPEALGVVDAAALAGQLLRAEQAKAADLGNGLRQVTTTIGCGSVAAAGIAGPVRRTAGSVRLRGRGLRGL